MKLKNVKDMEIYVPNLQEKWRVLRIMGYDVDATELVVKDGKVVIDKYTDEPVRFRDCDILPGRDGEPIIINDGIFGLVCYFTDIEIEDEEQGK